MISTNNCNVQIATGAGILFSKANIVFESILAQNIGIRSATREEQNVFSILVPAGTKLPFPPTFFKFSLQSTTQASLSIEMYEGDSPTCELNTFLEGFQIRNIPVSTTTQARDVDIIINVTEQNEITIKATVGDLKGCTVHQHGVSKALK